jgi:Ser/Thr protein kinase RdoA (MazF antagonist)
MSFIDFNDIVREAWEAYDNSREILRIEDISAKVSTNHVYRITLRDRNFIVAKLSYFGKFEHFVEDHTIINSLSNNLPEPYENVLARSLMKGNELFVHRHQSEIIDAWVVFYRPIKIRNKLPKRLNEDQIVKLGKEMARFHKACDTVKGTLPHSAKTMNVDIDDLLETLNSPEGRYEFHMHLDLIHEHCEKFKKNYIDLDADSLSAIPVFVDWNIGNFSVTSSYKLFSRWDYDWFRMSSRIMDFYFFSRVVSDIGDRTVFTYNIDVLTQDRFLLFLKSYHKHFPLTEQEILLIRETYRFFLLTYVVKYGRYFFHELFATKLQKEAFEDHFPSIDKKFDPKPLLNALDL